MNDSARGITPGAAPLFVSSLPREERGNGAGRNSGKKGGGGGGVVPIIFVSPFS